MKTVELSNKEVRMLLSIERDYFKLPIGVPDGTYRAEACIDNKGALYFNFWYETNEKGINAELCKPYYPPYQPNEVISIDKWDGLFQLKVISCRPNEYSMGNWDWLTRVEVLDDEC